MFVLKTLSNSYIRMDVANTFANIFQKPRKHGLSNCPYSEETLQMSTHLITKQSFSLKEASTCKDAQIVKSAFLFGLFSGKCASTVPVNSSYQTPVSLNGCQHAKFSAIVHPWAGSALSPHPSLCGLWADMATTPRCLFGLAPTQTCPIGASQATSSPFRHRLQEGVSVSYFVWS